MSIFSADQVLTVTTFGPGKLTLLTYDGLYQLQANIGAKSTTNAGQTRWLISFSHNYNGFAFIWDGKGQAVHRIGSSLLTGSVGTDWTNASVVNYGSSSVTQADVSSDVSGAINRDDATTFWVIPDTI